VFNLPKFNLHKIFVHFNQSRTFKLKMSSLAFGKAPIDVTDSVPFKVEQIPLGVCFKCGIKQKSPTEGGYWNTTAHNCWVCFPCKYEHKIRLYPMACEWCAYQDVKFHQGNTYSCPRCAYLKIGQGSTEVRNIGLLHKKPITEITVSRTFSASDLFIYWVLSILIGYSSIATWILCNSSFSCEKSIIPIDIFFVIGVIFTTISFGITSILVHSLNKSNTTERNKTE
jgi:hypothetical protein